jgi:hypothetical protein
VLCRVDEYEKGMEKERLDNARKMKKLGVASEIIMQVTGLNREAIIG